MPITPEKIKATQDHILKYYYENKRELPWRNTINPYHILVSEIMLQQTQVDRVIPYFNRFLTSFPKIQDLANADKKTLLEHWQGLGYNSRALRLQKLAQHLTEEANKLNQKPSQYEKPITPEELFPKTETELLKLPGIGPYTANAILAFAFNKDVAVVDTNIRRVFIHEFQIAEDTSDKALQNIAHHVLPKGKARDWYNALMDYGATFATARKTGIKSLGKQGKFEGSDRWVRGRIIKALVKSDTPYLIVSDIVKEYGEEQVTKVLNKMEKEEIIQKEKNKVYLQD